MTATLDSEKVAFTPRSGASWREPWGMYAALRDHDPVHHVVPEHRPHRDYWVLSRYRDVVAAGRDYETFSSRQGLTFHYGELKDMGVDDSPPLVMMDPPEHTGFRRMVAKAFTPRTMAAFEPQVREFVVERIEQLRAAGGGDVVKDLFKPLPSMVVAHFLGVPKADRSRFDYWTDAIVAATAAGAPPHMVSAVGELYAFFTELIERRKVEPGDDLVSHLVSCGLGADGDSAGLRKILGFAFTMVTGGNDTTTGLLGGTALLLTRHRDQRALLVEDPARISDAVEEFLRLTSPVQGLARMATRDVQIEGVTIPAGRKTLLLYASANRDPRQYGPDSEELNVLRKPQAIMTFGTGNHHCPGTTVARLQAKVAIEELLARCPDFDVDSDAVEYAEGNFVRRPITLPFTPST